MDDKELVGWLLFIAILVSLLVALGCMLYRKGFDEGYKEARNREVTELLYNELVRRKNN